MCVGGIVALGSTIGTMLVADYAAAYLIGSVSAVMPAQATTVATVALNAKKGVKWAQTASKLMTSAKYMKNGWTVGKIIVAAGGTTACFAKDTEVDVVDKDDTNKIIKKQICHVKKGDYVLTYDSAVNEAVPTKVVENKEHRGDYPCVKIFYKIDGIFQNVTVTLDHVMIGRKKEFINAKNVKVGDYLYGIHKTKDVKIEKIETGSMVSKWELVTSERTVTVNGILVSTLCQNCYETDQKN